jgi:hypothetical protein
MEVPDSMKGRLDGAAAQIDIIQNGRFATLLFIIGSLLNFIRYNYDEKVVFDEMFNQSNKSLIFDNELNADKISEAVSIIILIAVIIYTRNAMTIFKLESANTSNKNNYQGDKIIACFGVLKVIGFFGAAICYQISTQELIDLQS